MHKVSLLQKFPLLLRSLSGLHWHVRLSPNKTFIFNSIFRFILFLLLFKAINKHFNRHMFCYSFSYLNFEYSQKVCDGRSIFVYVRHVRPSQANKMFSIQSSRKERAALLASEHTKHQIKYCRCVFLWKSVFFKEH